MDEEKKESQITSIIIAVIAVIVILALVSTFYYYATRPVPEVQTNSVTVNIPPKKAPVAVPVIPQVVPTNVIKFAPPETLPTETESGNCWTNSIGALRADAWRCMVGNSISDPCFETSQTGIVFCQTDPTAETSFLIKLTKPLPAAQLPANVPDNWAWFLTLKDGTKCSPFTGTRPIFNPGPNAQVGYYGCTSADKTQEIILLGDLTPGTVWTATKAILTKSTGKWEIQSANQADVDTVWQ